MGSFCYAVLIAFIFVLSKHCNVDGQYEWQVKDAFDEIRMKLDKVNGKNCRIQHLEDLVLPEDTVSHKPDIKDINVNPVFPNRTALVHIHNLALSRAFFFSYILQARFIRPAINDTYDPGMMYYFLSTVADVAANPYINASGVYFSPNMSYSSSYRGFFNKTFPRFAPRTFREDDFNDPIHLERISTMNTFYAQDLGGFPLDRESEDYTKSYKTMNDWYREWLPDDPQTRHDTKTTYQVEIRYANNTNETFTFHGPPGPDETRSPVQFVRPYFDCGRSNKWLVAAVSPVADIYPRHTGFRHIEFPRYSAAIVLELDFDRIDINQCPVSPGNDKPNRFADTARCKNETTECEPLQGWGFRRGGYQCRCNPGYRLPNVVRRPYLGEIIERATADQYYNMFDCMKIGWIHKYPVQWEKATPPMKDKYMQRYREYTNFTRGAGSSHDSRINVHEVVKFIRGVREDTCSNYTADQLKLTGDFAFGAQEFFANQARMAVRLSNFISAFLQVSDPNEVYSEKRLADKPLTEDQMIAETLSLVASDFRIFSAGTYWDINKFTNRTLFAPFAYRKVDGPDHASRKFKIEDLARLNKPSELGTQTPNYFPGLNPKPASPKKLSPIFVYMDILVPGNTKSTKEMGDLFFGLDRFWIRASDFIHFKYEYVVYTGAEFFKVLKQRWSTNFDSLEKNYVKMKIRYNETGEYLKKFEHYPTYYKAANLKQGYWSDPYFDCKGPVKKWLIQYSVPFFGYDSLKYKLEFKGVVSVSMDLLKMDINQCTGAYYEPNTFRGTHKCDQQTSDCVPILGREYEIGGYKCECLQGYEYPFEDPITYFDGQLMEAEFINIVNDEPTRFDMFQCRLAGASSIQSSILLLALSYFIFWFRL